MKKTTNLFRLPPGEAMCRLLYKEYTRSAKNRGHEWLISLEEFKKITKENCYYCDTPPSTVMDTSKYSKSKGNHSPGMRRCNGPYIYNGIDRIRNSEGYTLENVVSCCNSCNYMKHTKSQEEFIGKCKQIAQKFS